MEACDRGRRHRIGRLARGKRDLCIRGSGERRRHDSRASDARRGEQPAAAESEVDRIQVVVRAHREESCWLGELEASLKRLSQLDDSTANRARTGLVPSGNIGLNISNKDDLGET